MAEPQPKHRAPAPCARLAALLERSTDPVASHVLQELIALEGRMLVLEARIGYLRERSGGAPSVDPPAPELSPESAKSFRHVKSAAEHQLLELLLVRPDLVSRAIPEVPIATVACPSARRILAAVYVLHLAAKPIGPAAVCEMLGDAPDLQERVRHLHHIGAQMPDPETWLSRLLGRLRQLEDPDYRRRYNEVLTRLRSEADPLPALRDLYTL